MQHCLQPTNLHLNKIIFFLLLLIIQTISDLLITSISMPDDSISQITTYNFQIIRFGDNKIIPNGTKVVINFPNGYLNNGMVTGCVADGWANAGVLSCVYSQYKLTISGGFPTSYSLESLGLKVQGVQNPVAANVYSPFTVNLVFPNDTSQIGTGSYTQTITTAIANCTMTLALGLVFGQGFITINYYSQFINSSSVGYTIKLSMLQSYPSDPTNTDINPILSVSNNMLAIYMFQFPFTNTFNITMLMPPSTQPQPNFIFILTSNILGDYDKCYISIQDVLPNNFITLFFQQVEVQSLANLQIDFLSITPVQTSDTIRINFTNTDFDLSQVSNFATFTKGVIGQKSVTRAGQVLSIRNIASFVIVSEIAFVLANVKYPYSTKPQSITIYIETDNGYLRNKQVYTYTAKPGELSNSTFACFKEQIGYTTSCTIRTVTKNQMNLGSYLQIKFPSGFNIVNGFTQCTSSGVNLNTVSNCNMYAITNTIRITGMIAASSSVVARGSAISVMIPNFNLPTTPSSYNIIITTFTQDGFAIDTATVNFMAQSRALLANQIQISPSSLTTSTATNYSILLSLPISLGLRYTFSLYLPNQDITIPTVNNNLLSSIYSRSTKILTIFNMSNTQLTITGFQTHQSTKPITLSGNITFNNIIYFYFQSYDITMQIPRQINVFNFTQSNSIVGKTFIANFIMSDLKANDIISMPNKYYALIQSDCSSNCICGTNGRVIVNSVNNYESSLTKITVNLVNLGYVSVENFDINILTQDGLYMKQTTAVTLRTQVTNILNISATQNNPYFTQNSTYNFNVNMTTAPPTNSLNNLLQVTIPSQYTILSWNCILGCTAPLPPPISGTLYFTIFSTMVSFVIRLQNPVSFLSPIQMTSISLGNMDYGTYLSVAPCVMPCRSCATNSTTQCLTCYQWSSQNKLRNRTCVSDCASGQFYENATLSCRLCHNYCLSCVNSSTTCYSCRPSYFYFQFSCLVTCPTSYFPASTGQCSSCSSSCLNCFSASNCTLCNNQTFLYQSSCWSSCRQGTYINQLFNQCLNCSNNCVDCNSSGCLQCSSRYYLFNRLCYLDCPAGFFKDVNTCVLCQSPCGSCSNYATNCTSCIISANNTFYYYLNNICYMNQCPDNYYISSLNNICLACQNPCKTCNRTQCLTCLNDLYYYLGFCSISCPNGTYPVTNMSCLVCPSPCATCLTSTSCLTCISPYLLFNSTCILICPDSYYKNQIICSSCQIPCLTCTSATICSSCSSLIYFNGTCLISCPVGQYSTSTIALNQTVRLCASCVYPCVTCTSNNSCLSCAQNLKLYNFGCQRSCPTSYYDSNNICFACSYPCHTCNQNGCLSCANSTLYLQNQKCLDMCAVLHPNNRTMICENCIYPCGTCTWSNTCISCLDPFIFYQGSCINTCPTGKYNSNRICVDCPANCSSCFIQSNQVRCLTCISGNYFYGYSCVTECPQTTTLSDPYCLSSNCKILTDCSTCSNFRCIECSTNFTLNTTTGKCEAVQGQSTVISSVSQIPVPFPFLIATIIIIICAFLIRIEFNKMFTPLFIYSFVGITQCGDFALWLALIYTKGINQFQTGSILKIAASVIIGIYVCLNIIGFILYIKITKNDKKFRVWEKQDNKFVSILVSIIGLILSFRFSMLKYSKLGHLQKFSATLSHDSKLNHENIMSYISIGLISIPTVVIAAWTSYLQNKMNYLFFTSLEIAVISVIMIILSIIQSLSPKGYTLQKKQQFKQGFDADGIDEQSLSQMMIKMGVVQEEYNENKQIVSEEENVGNRNISNQQQEQRSPEKTSQALIFTKVQDQKLSIQSDIPESLISEEPQSIMFSVNTPTLPVPIKDEKQALIDILIEAQKRQQELNRPIRPIRPIGTIKKQSLPQFFDNQSSQEIQSDDEPPPINYATNSPQKNNQKKFLRKQQSINLLDLKTFLDVEERKLGMKRLQALYEKLKQQQKQQKQLRQRLQKITQQQKILKIKQYEKARQIIQRNQMNVQQKLSKVQKLMHNRSKEQKIRKQKIKQMEQKRKQDRINRNNQKSQKIALVYPINSINEQIQQQQKSSFIKQNQVKNILPIESELLDEIQWVQEPKLNFQPTNEWKISQQRISPSLQNKQTKNPENVLRQDTAQSFSQIELDHWPIDPQLEQKIIQIQERAQEYIKKKRIPTQRVQQYDIELQSDAGTGAQQILYKQQQQQNQEMYDDNIKGHQIDQSKFMLNIDDNIQIPKRRINRNVINLSPN